MEVWLLEYSRPNDGETSVSVWAREQDALEEVVSTIKGLIDRNWDMDDPDMLAYAEEIDALMDTGNLRGALQKWNDFQDEHNSDYAEYYNVYSRPVNGLESVGNTAPAPSGTYRASSPGATCRGHCKEYNEYAYADRRDGTYVCRQCATFQHIFGG